MIDVNSPTPLYEQIKDLLLQGIQKGDYKPGDRIPSERDLSVRFGVSRLTVNKALKELERAGVLIAQVGKGTFISAEIVQQQLEHLTGFTEEMRSRGHSASSRVLSATYIFAPDDAARLLNVLPGTRLIQLQRVRLAEEQPIALETANLPASLCPDLLDKHDFAHESLYGALRREYGITLTHAEQTIEARPATREEADALGIKVLQPVLSMTRVAYTDGNRPVEYVRSAYRGDRYKFRVVLRNL
ncbi:MAG: GntR family transcriptional regulator [Anaerolinea sp.]|nr:GntR family transcriptional regulator [Anaerolinea sp.]